MTSPWQDRLFAESREWLIESLCDQDIERVVPEGDPIRVWWDDTSANRTARLLEIVSGATDTLTWLALVDAARARQAAPSGLEGLFTEALSAAARSGRMMSYPQPFHAFLSYSHRDMDRALAVVEILAEQGLRVFQDVRDIRAGESILGTLHAAMTRAPRAILLVTDQYAHSVWAHRELSLLRNRHSQGELSLFPVLLDDVPLPPLIEDTFTIDLRGFRGAEDGSWARERLAKLIDACKTR
ncbi:MAG TPA: toll/interleukin-1 receptor domain-containing protein [Candidatus Acidoferrales bacterium]|jgi:hypothetical protein|nr:toll/interleukin-1 receptor domain-containing protein [Candidatus Acidoferrales bacterium]